MKVRRPVGRAESVWRAIVRAEQAILAGNHRRALEELISVEAPGLASLVAIPAAAAAGDVGALLEALQGARVPFSLVTEAAAVLAVRGRACDAFRPEPGEPGEGTAAAVCAACGWRRGEH